MYLRKFSRSVVRAYLAYNFTKCQEQQEQEEEQQEQQEQQGELFHM